MKVFAFAAGRVQLRPPGPDETVIGAQDDAGSTMSTNEDLTPMRLDDNRPR